MCTVFGLNLHVCLLDFAIVQCSVLVFPLLWSITIHHVLPHATQSNCLAFRVKSAQRAWADCKTESTSPRYRPAVSLSTNISTRIISQGRVLLCPQVPTLLLWSNERKASIYNSDQLGTLCITCTCAIVILTFMKVMFNARWRQEFEVTLNYKWDFEHSPPPPHRSQEMEIYSDRAWTAIRLCLSGDGVYIQSCICTFLKECYWCMLNICYYWS